MQNDPRPISHLPNCSIRALDGGEWLLRSRDFTPGEGNPPEFKDFLLNLCLYFWSFAYVFHCFTLFYTYSWWSSWGHQNSSRDPLSNCRAFPCLFFHPSFGFAAHCGCGFAFSCGPLQSLCSMLTHLKGMFPPCGRSLNYDASGPGTHQIFKHLSFPKHKNKNDRAVFMSVPSGGDGCAFRCASRCALRGFCGCGFCVDGFDWALRQRHSHTNKDHVEQFMLSLPLLSRFSANDLLNSWYLL